jgi:hypothetical protein
MRLRTLRIQTFAETHYQKCNYFDKAPWLYLNQASVGALLNRREFHGTFSMFVDGMDAISIELPHRGSNWHERATKLKSSVGRKHIDTI